MEFNKKRILNLSRKRFGRNKENFCIPYILAIQIDSFNQFINNNNNNKSGLEKVLNSFFPLINKSLNFELRYINYRIGRSIYNDKECLIRGITYSAPLKVKLALILYPDGENSNYVVKEQEVYFCDIPLMTKKGSFVINGTERVLVSQIKRTPGVFFDSDKGNEYGKILYNAKIIPAIGSWLDFEFDKRDFIYFRIDRKRKIPVTVLLKALNTSFEEILNLYIKKINLNLISTKQIRMFLNPRSLLGDIAVFTLKRDNILYVEKGEKINLKHIKLMEEDEVFWVDLPLDDILGKKLSKNYVDISTGQIIGLANHVITEKLISDLLNAKIDSIEIIYDEGLHTAAKYLKNTQNFDNTKDRASALNELNSLLNPGGFSRKKQTETFVKDFLFTSKKNYLSEVGRFQINRSLNIDINLCNFLTLTKQDIILTLKKLIDIKGGTENIDDIDHLGNKRIICVGEMLENQFRSSLRKMERIIQDRLKIKTRSSLKPEDVIYVKPLSSFIKEFFTSSQFSQFLDQTNPLSEITHKRRISSLGPGGITRERASFEVRDVHTTHYGRICPIETPEGPNIGLINSFALYAHVNKYGFIETPYIKVIKGSVTTDVEYFSAYLEDNYIIAPADAKRDKNNEFIEDFIVCRYKGETSLFPKDKIDYIDVSNYQILSITAGLIPFIEHNDSNRALMGANMQKQAVPLLINEKPLIGTGLERKAAYDAGVTVIAKRGGIVFYVDAYSILIKVDNMEVENDYSCIDRYKLSKYLRSNQNTCINQRPCVVLGEKVKRGDIIADGPATDMGELSLGKNLRVAFMPWYGYNFEDSIIISEKVIQEQKFTSIHINELICYVRDTKIGEEKITCDIPYLTKKAVSKLDESGIINLGAEVTEGDILVGKVTPRVVTKVIPEEKLLVSILGKKAASIRDTSLKVPKGMSGTVIDVKIFNRAGIEKDKRTLLNEYEIYKDYLADLDIEYNILLNNIFYKIKSVLKKELFLDKKTKIILDRDFANIEHIKYLLKLNFKDNMHINIKINDIREQFKIFIKEFISNMKLENKKFDSNSDLSPGIIKIVKVYLATKKNIQPGDKIAGRHGNKGVVSKICPVEDMPYDESGNPVDIILNPLSVPSRMNVGQLFETHVGLALKELGAIINRLLKKDKINEIRALLQEFYNIGYHKLNLSDFSDEDIRFLAYNIRLGIPIATPVFDGVTEDDIEKLFKLVSLPLSGQIYLYDGYTGEKFERPITVGYMYILKLNHLVDEKIHARSTGAYSLITQQPLGGKAQFGGQRFGEMEVWALEAYGAAFTLQEMLTVKSDDVDGRAQMYKNIVNGDLKMFTTIPECFNVLLKEIRSLCIALELVK